MAHSSLEILKKKLEQAAELVEVGATYEHTKTGGRYTVTGLVFQEKDEQIGVIYHELGQKPPINWCRSLLGEGGWISEPPRFKRISD